MGSRMEDDPEIVELEKEILEEYQRQKKQSILQTKLVVVDSMLKEEIIKKARELTELPQEQRINNLINQPTPPTTPPTAKRNSTIQSIRKRFSSTKQLGRSRERSFVSSIDLEVSYGGEKVIIAVTPDKDVGNLLLRIAQHLAAGEQKDDLVLVDTKTQSVIDMHVTASQLQCKKDLSILHESNCNIFIQRLLLLNGSTGIAGGDQQQAVTSGQSSSPSPINDQDYKMESVGSVSTIQAPGHRDVGKLPNMVRFTDNATLENIFQKFEEQEIPMTKSSSSASSGDIWKLLTSPQYKVLFIREKMESLQTAPLRDLLPSLNQKQEKIQLFAVTTPQNNVANVCVRLDMFSLDEEYKASFLKRASAKDIILQFFQSDIAKRILNDNDNTNNNKDRDNNSNIMELVNSFKLVTADCLIVDPNWMLTHPSLQGLWDSKGKKGKGKGKEKEQENKRENENVSENESDTLELFLGKTEWEDIPARMKSLLGVDSAPVPSATNSTIESQNEQKKDQVRSSNWLLYTICFLLLFGFLIFKMIF